MLITAAVRGNIMFNTVLELLKSRNYKAIREIFMDMNEADVAALLQQFYDDHEVEKYELPLLFRLLNKDVAADVFAYMDSDTQMSTTIQYLFQ